MSNTQYAQHSPGPWTADHYGNVRDAHGKLVPIKITKSRSEAGSPMYRNAAANERVAVAAPELLEALESMRDAYQEMFDVMPVAWQTYDNIAEAAIAKAKGGE